MSALCDVTHACIDSHPGNSKMAKAKELKGLALEVQKQAGVTLWEGNTGRASIA